MKAAHEGHEGFGGGNQFFAELSSVNPVVMCVRTQIVRSAAGRTVLILPGLLSIGCRAHSRSA
jgi:hypothetical protein